MPETGRPTSGARGWHTGPVPDGRVPNTLFSSRLEDLMPTRLLAALAAGTIALILTACGSDPAPSGETATALVQLGPAQRFAQGTTFTAAVAPTHPGQTDPVEANNTASASSGR